MSFIPQTDIDKVLEAANIVDVISSYITLKKHGVNHFCSCPFHNDRTASMSVSPGKQIWKCFSCGKGGNAITFVEQYENVSFPEAVRIVAKKYHLDVAVQEETPEEITKRKHKESLYIILEAAKELYRKNLQTDQKVLTYLQEQRKIVPELIDTFAIGAAFAWDDLVKQLTKSGYSLKLLEEVGLAKEGKTGHFDYFRNRVLFPFFDVQGRVIGFTGRALDPTDKIKYQNSPDTPLFTKSKALFGLFQARNEISRADKVYLVEGQFDVLSFVQAGVANTVCGSGTAMPPEQIKQLLRFTKNITLIYDADQAGQKAALTNIEKLVDAGAKVRAISLPDGQDPDDFAKKIGKDLPAYLLKHEEAFVHYLYKRLHSDSDEALQDEALNIICKIIAKEREKDLRAGYMRSLCKLAAIGQEVVNRKVKAASGHLKEETDVMASGFYGIEEAKEQMSDEYDSCYLTTRFSEFADQLDNGPIVLMKGIPDTRQIQQLRMLSTTIEIEDPEVKFDEKKECEFLMAVKQLFKEKFTINIADNEEEYATGFINYYIGLYGQHIKGNRLTEDIVDIYLARVAEMISYAPETTRIRQMKEWAGRLGMPNERSLKDIVKPFLDQRKAKRIADREQLDVDADILVLDTETVPDYVEENEAYKKAYVRYGFYPLLNKNGLPVSYMFKNDGNTHVRVSDFYMEPLLHISSPDKENNKRVMKLNHLYLNRTKYVEWKSSTLANMSMFEEMLINEGPYNFENGESKHFKKIRQYMSYNFLQCFELKVFGQQKEDFFAFSNAIFHKVDGEYRIDMTNNLGVVEHEDQHYYSPAFSEIYSRERSDQDRYAQDRWLVYNEVPAEKRLTFERWAWLMDKVYKVNENGKWALIYAIMCCFRSDIHPIDRLFTSIFFIGPTQSGKTQIAVSIRSLFISSDAPSFNLNNGTDAAFFSILERFRDVPQIMEEYNDELLSPNKFQGLKSVTYDGDGKQKRKSATGNDVETSQVNAPVILLGQESPQRDDSSLSNRVVLCEVPKRDDLNNKEVQEIFEELKTAEKSGLCYLLLEVLKLRPLFRKNFIAIQRACRKELNDNINKTSNNGGEQTRIINTISLFLATCKLIEEYAPHLKLPFTYNEFFQIGLDKVRTQVDLIARTDKLAQFFSTIDYLIDRGTILPGRDFKIERPGKITLKDFGEIILSPIDTKVIYMNITNVHKMYSMAATGEKPMTLTTLNLNLKSHPAFIGAVNNTRFHWEEAGEVSKGGTTTDIDGQEVPIDNTARKVMKKLSKQNSAIVLNYDILKKYMGIDFEREGILPEDDPDAPF